jgi:hypothetical protein
MELGPALWQILIYFAFPGTPFHRKVLAEGLYPPSYQEKPDYRTFDGFSMHFKHLHFTAEELENIQSDLYRRAFEHLGLCMAASIPMRFLLKSNIALSRRNKAFMYHIPVFYLFSFHLTIYFNTMVTTRKIMRKGSRVNACDFISIGKFK